MEANGDGVFKVANLRGMEKRAAYPQATAVRYDRRIARIVIVLDSGLELSLRPSLVQGLENARPTDLDIAEISPSGMGIHFPKIDADIHIPGLLDGLFGTKNWMAARHGQLGGQSTSTAKRLAAQKNGKLGGRPRKKITEVD